MALSALGSAAQRREARSLCDSFSASPECNRAVHGPNSRGRAKDSLCRLSIVIRQPPISDGVLPCPGQIRDKHTLLVGAADVVDGSPILDIKPLVPFCDCPADAWAPSWVDAAPVGDPLRVDAVSFTDSASRRLEEVGIKGDEQAWPSDSSVFVWVGWGEQVWMASSSSLFKSAQDLEGAVKSCLSRDVRSLNQRQQGRSDGVYTLEMDCVKVEYTRSATRTSLVIDASAL